MKLGKSLTELAQQLERNAAAKTDYVADTREITMSVTPEPASQQVPVGLVVGGGGALEPTDHCHHQIATWSGIGTRYYDKMMQDSPALLAGNVNHWLHKSPEKECRRMVRTMDGTARAFLSDRYLRLDNEHVAESAFKALEAVPEINVVSCDVTDKKLYIKAVFPRTEGEVKVGDAVQSGVVIRNSEIGGGSYEALPFWYRLWCLNGCASMVKGEGYRRRHLGGKVKGNSSGIIYQQDTIEAAAQAALLECRDAVTTFADPEYFSKVIETLREAAQSEQTEQPIKAVEVLGKAIGLNQGEQDSILERFIRNADYSKYGMLNAVTNLANDTESYDRASELEVLGGKVLNLSQSQWHEVAQAA
jgi:hypothetical protein